MTAKAIDVLFNPAATKLLLAINGNTIRKIGEETKISTRHLRLLIDEFRSENIIYIKRMDANSSRGRRNVGVVFLTKYGTEIRDITKGILGKMRRK